MASLALYANLAAVLDGQRLKQQTGLSISDKVNEPCRITVSSAYPMSAVEFDARAALGKRVKLQVFILDVRRELGTEVITVEGPITESTIDQVAGHCAGYTFTVENDPPRPHDAEGGS